MDTTITLALTAALLALGALLAYGVFDAWRRPKPLPFFEVLERHGLSVTQAEAALGREAFAAAVQRCAQCSDRQACARALDIDRLGRDPHAPCANAELFEQVKGAELQHA